MAKKKKLRRALLITDNNPRSGMYYVAKQMNGDIFSYKNMGVLNRLFRLIPFFGFLPVKYFKDYDEVITFLHPMHKYGKKAKDKYGCKWIAYDMGVPPAELFRNPIERFYMFLFNTQNGTSMQGADEHWDLENHPPPTRIYDVKQYALFVGRDTDYKRIDVLKEMCDGASLELVHLQGVSDTQLGVMLDNCNVYATASLWEGYDMPVAEAQDRNIPVVCWDIGQHLQMVTLGSVIPVGEKEQFVRALKKWSKYYY